MKRSSEDMGPYRITPRPVTRGRIRYDWWRAHHGWPQHGKWRSVAKAADVPVSVAFHIVACLLDTASQGQPRGSIDTFKAFDCAGTVDVEVAAVERVLAVLRDIKWLEGHMIAQWDDRQPQREDEGAARRKAEQRSRAVTSGHGDVTQSMRDSNDCHASDAGQVAVSQPVTTLSAPDLDIDTSTSSSESLSAREQESLDRLSAGPLASARPAGALASQPDAEQEPAPKSLAASPALERVMQNRGWAPRRGALS